MSPDAYVRLLAECFAIRLRAELEDPSMSTLDRRVVYAAAVEDADFFAESLAARGRITPPA